mmetsp:Transcript_7611/g.24392  ORF Transcript_7611/g.24392 Transcript_7611/m.24392 type:complete len:200 (-) Transcript_7611:281-880(-)
MHLTQPQPGAEAKNKTQYQYIKIRGRTAQSVGHTSAALPTEPRVGRTRDPRLIPRRKSWWQDRRRRAVRDPCLRGARPLGRCGHFRPILRRAPWPPRRPRGQRRPSPPPPALPSYLLRAAPSARRARPTAPERAVAQQPRRRWARLQRPARQSATAGARRRLEWRLRRPRRALLQRRPERPRRHARLAARPFAAAHLHR